MGYKDLSGSQQFESRSDLDFQSSTTSLAQLCKRSIEPNAGMRQLWSQFINTYRFQVVVNIILKKTNINGKIRARKVLLIDQTGTKQGIVDTQEALALAQLSHRLRVRGCANCQDHGLWIRIDTSRTLDHG